MLHEEYHCIFRPVSSPFCGDGVAEGGERCDCGTTRRCLAERSTCAPAQGGGGGIRDRRKNKTRTSGLSRKREQQEQTLFNDLRHCVELALHLRAEEGEVLKAVRHDL